MHGKIDTIGEIHGETTTRIRRVRSSLSRAMRELGSHGLSAGEWYSAPHMVLR